MSENGMNNFDPRRAPTDSREMEWFKNLKIPLNPSHKEKEKRNHRAPRDLSVPLISKTKSLKNNNEVLKKLAALAALHKITLSHTLNEIVKAYYQIKINSVPASETNFVERSRAHFKNYEKLEINKVFVKNKLGLSLHKENNTIFNTIRNNQLKSAAQILEEAICVIYESVFPSEIDKKKLIYIGNNTAIKFRSPKKQKYEDGYSPNIGFKCNKEQKQRLVRMASFFDISQNSIAVIATDLFYEAIANDKDLYQLLESRFGKEKIIQFKNSLSSQ